MKLDHEPGTRFSNAVVFDEATTQVVHGWQVFAQRRVDGTYTGRKSFIARSGSLTAISLAKKERDLAMRDAAPELLEALIKCARALSERMDVTCPDDVKAFAAAKAAIRAAAGIMP